MPKAPTYRKRPGYTQDAVDALTSRPEKAEKLLREALTCELYHGPAHNNLGVLYLNQGRLYYRKLMPGHPDPRVNLGLTFEQAGRSEEALLTYATALEVYPDYLPAVQAIARLQVRNNCFDGRTQGLLQDVALRGESEEWRSWARMQIARRGSHAP